MLDTGCWRLMARRGEDGGGGKLSDLEVYQLAFALAVEVDGVSKALPKHEMYEEGSQLRRAAKSIPANIAEGFGRRRYTQEYIRFIIFALASCDETRVHLDLLHRTSTLSGLI